MSNLRRAVLALSVCAPLALAGQPALAADMVMPRGAATGLTESDVGKPYWVLLSQCAGMFSAAYSVHSSSGDADKAEADKLVGTAMLNAAVDRLVRDRGLDRKTALAMASEHLAAGRETGSEIIARGTRSRSPWNAQRSACMDIHDGYVGKYG
ncbi:MAG TPA: hypothetical protein VEA44_02765 [Caulobacter sp.]|nr:hypothetical protein [Caulobacter sp.]